MFTKTQLFAILASTAAAVPAASPASSAPVQSENFTLIAIHSGNQLVHQRSINAFEGELWIGEPTLATAQCGNKPSSECPTHTTVFYTQGGKLQLAVSGAGGQAVYVAPTGYLSFNQGGNETYPAGSVFSPFSWAAPGKQGLSAPLKTPATLYACPIGATGTDTFKVIADNGTPDQECIEIGADGFQFDGENDVTYYT